MRTTRDRSRWSGRRLAALSVTLLTLAACGDDGGGAGENTENSVDGAGSDEDVAIPEGTVLRVADQANTMETMLAESGELDAVPYEIDFINFMGGPPVNEAFAAEEIDLGMMFDLPTIHNVGGEIGSVNIATLAYDGTGSALYAREDSGIESLDDLAGRNIAYARGTISHAFVLRALHSLGLDESDITSVDVPLTELPATLSRGDADAGIIFEHAQFDFVNSNPDAVELATYGDIVDIYGFLLAAPDAVEDPARGAALEDFVARYSRSLDWVFDNRDLYIESYYIDSYGLDPEPAQALADAVGFAALTPTTDEIHQSLQDLADLYYEAGEMPHEVDMADMFVPEIMERFNDALEADGATLDSDDTPEGAASGDADTD